MPAPTRRAADAAPQPKPAPPVLELRGATFTYEGAARPSAEDVTLSVAAGECVVLCGESGCGKTTVTRLANGLAGEFYEGERRGEVRVGGAPLQSLSQWEVAERVGSVFQNPRTQFFNLDTTGEIAFGMENLAVPRAEMHARMASTARELGIEALLDRNIFALSGGQKQAVAFAGAHTCRPAAYVLDEPSSNLDPAAMDDLARLIRTAKQRGAAVLVAEHRLAYLADAADRFIFMRAGRVEREWTAEAFAALSAEERGRLGLRSPHPPALPELEARLAARASAAPACEARGLVAEYERGRAVLDGCTMAFDAGSVTGITGPNGAGKSTLLSCLCGLKCERMGHVRFAGEVVPPRRRADRAFLVMQDPDYQLFRESVRAELSCAPRAPDAADTARIDELLARFDLADVADRHPATLSGGQKQRVVCAMAALSPADVLLFDEPTSGLDHAGMRRLARLMRELARDGRAVAVVSHDTEFLACACHRIVRLEPRR